MDKQFSTLHNEKGNFTNVISSNCFNPKLTNKRRCKRITTRVEDSETINNRLYELQNSIFQPYIDNKYSIMNNKLTSWRKCNYSQITSKMVQRWKSTRLVTLLHINLIHNVWGKRTIVVIWNLIGFFICNNHCIMLFH